MTTELALTPAAAAAAASVAIRAEVRQLTVTGPDLYALLRAVEVDIEVAPTVEVDSDEMAVELMNILGRLSTVSSAIEAERKERGEPLRATLQWLMDGYSPTRAMLDKLIEDGKKKLTAYNRAKAELKRIADETAARARREEAARKAKDEAEAIAAAQAAVVEAARLRDEGSEQVAQALECKAMMDVDIARQNAQVAAQAIYTAPVRSASSSPVKGTGGAWSAQVTDKAKLIAHVGAMIASGDLSLVSALDANPATLNALAKMQMTNMALPGVQPVFTERVSIRKQGVAA